MKLFLIYLRVLLHGNKGRFKSFKDYKKRRAWALAKPTHPVSDWKQEYTYEETDQSTKI